MTIKFEETVDGKKIMDINPDKFFEHFRLEDGSISCDAIVCNLFYMMQRSDLMLSRDEIIEMMGDWWERVVETYKIERKN